MEKVRGQKRQDTAKDRGERNVARDVVDHVHVHAHRRVYEADLHAAHEEDPEPDRTEPVLDRDGMALMLLTTPIFLPIAIERGLSPIWFGIFLVRSMEIGFVHPPVGMNVFVIHDLARDIPLTTIFRGVLPFLAADFLHLALLILVPALSLWLPSFVGM